MYTWRDPTLSLWTAMLIRRPITVYLLGVNTDIVIYEAFSIFAMGNEIYEFYVLNSQHV